MPTKPNKRGPKPKRPVNPNLSHSIGGRRGPPPEPTRVLELKGSWLAGQRKEAGEPEPDLGRPNLPGWVSEAAYGYWPEICEQLELMNVVTKADGLTLGLLCDQLAIYIKATRMIIDAGGPVIEKPITAGGKHVGDVLVPHPAVKMRDGAWDRTLRIAREFGLTPSSRAGVRAENEAKGKDDKSRFFESA